jgi:putative membrane protein
MMGGWGMGWVWIWPVLVLVGLAILAYVGVRLAQGGRSAPPGDASTARQILDERYARGEIDEEEYRHRRSTLQ